MSHTTIDMLLKVYEACTEPLYMVLDGIPDEQLNWKPAPESRAIGSIMNHLIRVDKDFFKKLGYNLKTTDKEGGGAEEISKALKSVHKEIKNIVQTFKDDSSIFERRMPGQTEKGTIGDIIMHISQHYLYHLSQVIYLRRAQDRQWQSPEKQWENATYVIAELLEPIRRIHKIEKVL